MNCIDPELPIFDSQHDLPSHYKIVALRANYSNTFHLACAVVVAEWCWLVRVKLPIHLGMSVKHIVLETKAS